MSPDELKQFLLWPPRFPPPLDSWLRCFYVTLILYPSAPFWQHLFQVCGFKSAFSTMGFVSLPFLESGILKCCAEPSPGTAFTQC